MRQKTVYHAAFRRGRLLPGSVLDTPSQVRRYVRAMFASEVAAGMHEMRNVFRDHGVTVERIMIVRFGTHRVPARRKHLRGLDGSPLAGTVAAPG